MTGTLKVDEVYHFDVEEKRKWFQGHWHLSLLASVVYMMFIHFGQKYMRKRQPFNLKPILVIWNAGLALFSIMGAFYVVPELLDTLEKGGFEASMCEVGSQYEGNCGYWSYLFVLSKIIELIDTVFLVLRKRPVIFLHSYHHASVLLASWYQYQHETATLRWGISMNYMVHSVMYTYYALRAAGYFVPRPVAMSVTVMQIIQMFIGFYISFLVFLNTHFGTDPDCLPDNPKTATVQLTIYTTYLILFVGFFKDTYFGNRSKKAEVKKME